MTMRKLILASVAALAICGAAQAADYILPPAGVALRHPDGSWTDTSGSLHKPIGPLARKKGYDDGELIHTTDGRIIVRFFITFEGKRVFADYDGARMTQLCEPTMGGQWLCSPPPAGY